MDERPANLVEELVRDGLAPQRERGVIPRVHDVKKYVTGIVERLEKKTDEERLRIKPKPVEREAKVRSTADMQTEYEKRARRVGLEPLTGTWQTTKDKGVGPQLKTLRRTTQVKLLQARLRLLRSKPDWNVKIKDLLPAMNGLMGEEAKLKAEFQFRELIKASDVTFGPWLKLPTKRLWFTK